MIEAEGFQALKDYWELSKPRLISMVLLSSMVGYYLGMKGNFSWPLFSRTLIGTALTAAGSMALNQWMETDRDAKMKRTENRPLPAGRLTGSQALSFGILTILLGIASLFFFVNKLSAMMSAFTVLSYLFFYTPLKPVTTYSTLAGAIPGAIPPLIGWAAVRGELSWEAWTLFAIIFFWQLPHFLAISWMFRHEFAAANFKMLAVVDQDGRQVARQMVYYSAILLPVSLLPTFMHLTGKVYFIGAAILGMIFIWNSLQCLRDLDGKARLLFRTSLVYLSVLLFLMVVDKQS